MIKKPRSVFYIDRGNFDYVRIASFSEYRENEMVFGFFGINSSEEPNYSHSYKDKYFTKDEMLSLRVNYLDAKEQKNVSIDHFTIHNEKPTKPNGEFHLKEAGKTSSAQKVSILPSTLNSEFLEFIIFTDLLSNYSKSLELPGLSDLIISASPEERVLIKGGFSALTFPLENTIKGCFTWENHIFDQIVSDNRPSGTYFISRFPEDQKNSFLVKTFVFS